MEISRITLGTAQLGLNYGIANDKGKPSKTQALKILSKAFDLGINSFDTAYAYGDSEELIGEFIKSKKLYQNAFITSKLPSISKQDIIDEQVSEFVISRAEESSRRLGIPIANYLVHDFSDYRKYKKQIQRASIVLKERRIIEMFGVSLYEPEEAEEIMKDKQIDAVQIPLGIFNQSFLKNGLLERLKRRDVKIFARSIFNQGLIFLNRKQILEKIPAALEWVEKLNNISRETEISVVRLATGFVASIDEIDSLVLGVESEEQLIDSKECVEYRLEKTIVEIISEKFVGIPQRVFDPRFWSANK
ncbi:aldo/keto reductase [Mesotoga sp. H07.pep.5.3]|uniref:aldo/keto reductase n=1 Tax=Mesotoga sp. H07.pep.5.3 TaxID=1421003 RepID=UPI000C19BD10|nr:aldo/keto reductase [Mesotoga sp. H07.pep.5.3]PIJ63009.1 hypothetical protein V513_02610 [Mesotoga sp. H07.pep.5.3]